jgi:flagellum-specific ATP synthase
LPRLVERAGRTERGSITAFYSVLVEGDDENEPIADCVRGLLDGHVWLSRRIAEKGHYPAIDVLRSISRLANELSTPDEKRSRQIIRELLAAYAENEDLITIGAYRKGANKTLDAAVEMREEIHRLLKQQVDEQVGIDQVRQDLMALAAKCLARMSAAPPAMGMQQQLPPMPPQRQGAVIKK